uniref:Cell proliferation regulating inhibitor of protein phosphatase 2A n=1 Tax=Eptatretus burgeri TaxID=7764 RepID=A0A8C4R2Z0_EPTBU
MLSFSLPFQKNVKSLYRSLIHFLAHSSLTVVVFALSILTSLTLGEEVGERLFHAKNIHQTFQLIFNILVNGEGKLTRKYSVDLFMDLLDNAKVTDLLTRYEHFSSCLRQILDLLRSKNGDGIEKVSRTVDASNKSASHLLCFQVHRSLSYKNFHTDMPANPHQLGALQFCLLLFFQDPRLVPFLTFALTSSDRRRVCSALRLLFESAPLPDFPTVMYVSSRRPFALLRNRLLLPSSFPFILATDLIFVLQLNSNGTDPRTSEIIDVYEQKLSSLATKENHLQDLLEAKASALVQADRMLSQYRCRCAQTEAEARRLAGLLREAERHCENLGAQLNEERAEGEQGRQDMERLLVHSRRLEAQMVRLTELEERLSKTVLAYGLITVLKLDKTLRDRSLLTITEGRKLESRNFIYLMNSLQDLLQTIKERDGQLAALEKERERSEETANAVRADLTRTEQARKELSIKTSSLELQKSAREREMKQLEERLREVEEREREARQEIQKNAQMIAMIHSLSSGKLQPGTVNLSL